MKTQMDRITLLFGKDIANIVFDYLPDYCDELECLEDAPCPIHDCVEYDFEVCSSDTIQSHFTSLTYKCEKTKHSDAFFGSCSHFVAYRNHQEGFIFTSQTMQLERNFDFWYENMQCYICHSEIQDAEDVVVNLADMCHFHDFCIMEKLHQGLEICPGCDPDICRACYKCDY